MLHIATDFDRWSTLIALRSFSIDSPGHWFRAPADQVGLTCLTFSFHSLRNELDTSDSKTKNKGRCGAPGIAQEVAALFKIMSECTHVGGYLLPGAPDSPTGLSSDRYRNNKGSQRNKMSFWKYRRKMKTNPTSSWKNNEPKWQSPLFGHLLHNVHLESPARSRLFNYQDQICFATCIQPNNLARDGGPHKSTGTQHVSTIDRNLRFSPGLRTTRKQNCLGSGVGFRNGL